MQADLPLAVNLRVSQTVFGIQVRVQPKLIIIQTLVLWSFRVDRVGTQ